VELQLVKAVDNSTMNNNLSLIWKSIADKIAGQVSESVSQRWFAPIQLLKADEVEVLLEVPDSIYQLWIENNYMPVVQGSILEILGAPRKINFCVANQPREKKEPPRAAESAQASQGGAVSAKPRKSAEGSNGASTGSHGMNPRNVFETFVVGTNNEYAHAASLAVANAPGKTYNPLFIHGGVGLGKTHLMHAVGQHVMTSGKAS
jgi:chromosomal replication initiator protein